MQCVLMCIESVTHIYLQLRLKCPTLSVQWQLQIC